MTSSVSSSPPANFLPGTFVTDLNRQALWNNLSDDQKASYTRASASSGSSGSSSSGSSSSGSGGTSSGSGSAPVSGFTSLGNQSTVLVAASFDNRTDAARSAKPTAATVQAYGKIWAGTDVLDRVLTAPPGTSPNGGAIFVTVAGALERPSSGTAGFESAAARGANPFGYFNDDNQFVWRKIASNGTATEETYATSTGYTTEAAWLKDARAKYDAYEKLVSSQASALTSAFKGSQGLLGFDVNNNGRIDDESELFGFGTAAGSPGLDINASANIVIGDPDATSPTTTSFTFLDNGRLNGDPLNINETNIDRSLFRRFQILTASGESVSVLQSGISENQQIGRFVTGQTTLTFDRTGATIRPVLQDGIGVTAQNGPVSATITSISAPVAETGTPTIYNATDSPDATATDQSDFDTLRGNTIASVGQLYDSGYTGVARTLTRPLSIGFDVNNNGKFDAGEVFGEGLDLSRPFRASGLPSGFNILSALNSIPGRTDPLASRFFVVSSATSTGSNILQLYQEQEPGQRRPTGAGGANQTAFIAAYTSLVGSTLQINTRNTLLNV